MKKTILLSLSLSLASSLLHAEDNGFFVSAGYQIGEAVQMVKNTGELKNLNEKYEQLSQSLAQLASLKRSIQTANNIQAVNNALSDLKSFASNNHTNKETSPIYNTAQAVITSVLAFWSLYAGNALSFHVTGLNDGSNSPLGRIHKDGNCTGLQNCFMKKETYDKMKTLAENLQKAQGNLCALSECSSNQSDKTSMTKALETAQQLMNLIEQTKVSMVWKNIVIAGVSNREGGAGAITSTGPVTDYAVFNNIKAMLPYLQEALKLTQRNHTLSDSLQAKATGSQNNRELAKNIYALAQNQKQILSNASSIFNLFNSIPKDQLKYLEKAYLKVPHLGQTPTNPYRQEVNLNQEVQTIKNNVSYYGNRIDSALSVARDVYNLKSNQTEIVTTYNDAKTLSEEISKLPYNKVNVTNIVMSPKDSTAGQYNYQINPEQQSNLNQALAAMSNNPFKKVGMISSQNNNGAMNGLGVQVGYKQFFGESKRWGLRYYGFFDYNHGYIKSSFFNSSSDIWTYGGGSDLLVNIINDSITRKNNKLSVGLFGGIQLAGTTWLNSQYVNLTAFNNPYSAKVNTSNFQFLFNLGLRTNLATAKKKDSEHSAQHGIELGIKIPTINTNYYSFLGTQLQYRRLYSVYLNYVFAY
ncbi:outer membrane protein [Helicobacter pylori G27]|uniref:Outer membrane protein n=1 Tax=Helicobacter pylori (strain G27) TaxID=563041 RepID=B5Z783_HELPG|nr:outer membrane protein [Helicobacter pylori]ACI27432.1 outer membrane protein [Helicobacter pylori G27]UEB13876.1 outer membrane protein [Helicobacter pylori]